MRILYNGVNIYDDISLNYAVHEMNAEKYKETGMIPDTLCTCVFAALFGECGAMAFIKTAKERRQDREWQQEDIRRAEETAKELSKGGQA